MKKLKLFTSFAALLTLMLSTPILAEELRSSDNSYILQIDNNGLGYENNDPNSQDQSGEYKLTGNLESFDSGYGDSTGNSVGDYRMKTGLQATFEANVPELSLLTSTDGTTALYDRLLVEIDPNGNPTTADGTLFALQVSSSSIFATFNYVNPTTFQRDAVTNSDLSVYYKPCAVTTNQIADTNRWDCGNVSGLKRYIKGLNVNTTYYVRAIAKNGDFTNSEPGPSLNATTQNITASLSLNSNVANFGLLNISSIGTASPATLVTANTNSQAGYAVYIKGQGDGSSAASSLYAGVGKIIPSTSGTLTAGAAGYGIQASSTSGTATVNPTWIVAGNTVGQLLRTTSTLFYKDPSNPSYTIGEDSVTINYKASISTSTVISNDYEDIVTYTMQVSPYNPN